MPDRIFISIYLLFITHGMFFYKQACAQQKNAGTAHINHLNLLAKSYLNSYPDSTLILGQKALIQSKRYAYGLGEATSNINLGSYQQYRGRYKTAYRYYLTALKIYEQQQLKPGLANAYNHLGDVYRKQNNFKEAYEYYQKSLNIYQQLNHPVGVVDNLNDLGDVYRKRKQYSKALRLYEQSMKIAQANNYLTGMMGNRNNQGDVYDQQKEYQLATNYYKKALKIAHQLDSKLDIAENLSSIGRVLAKLGKNKEALRVLKQSIVIAQKHRFLEELRDAYWAMSTIYLKEENYQLTYRYYQHYAQIKDTLYNTNSVVEIARLRQNYESERQTQKIALLERDKQLQRISNYMLIGGLILLLSISVLIFYWQRTKIEKNRELLKQNQRIYETQQELIKVELANTQLNEQKLKIELENKRLKEQQLQYTLEAQNKSLTSHALLIIQKNKMLNQINEKLTEIIQNNGRDTKKRLKDLKNLIGDGFSFDKEWKEFKVVFEQVHEDFFEKLKANHSKLTSSETRLCALLKLNLSSKDMAAIMGISQDSLRIARYRLRKKLALPKGSNLTSFIMNI